MKNIIGKITIVLGLIMGLSSTNLINATITVTNKTNTTVKLTPKDGAQYSWSSGQMSIAAPEYITSCDATIAGRIEPGKTITVPDACLICGYWNRCFKSADMHYLDNLADVYNFPEWREKTKFKIKKVNNYTFEIVE